jgi:suppressor for copper-sensitivity B
MKRIFAMPAADSVRFLFRSMLFLPKLTRAKPHRQTPPCPSGFCRKLFRLGLPAWLGLAFALLGLSAFAQDKAAGAAALPWVGGPEARMRLIAAQTSAQATAEIGLEVRLAKGWKFYWRNPGEAGLKPAFDWSRSVNLASSEVRYPRPERFELGGFESFVYSDHVVLPIGVAKEDPSRPLALRLRLDYGICEEICLPRTDELALDLPAGPGLPKPEAALIARFQAMVPKPAESLGARFEVSRARLGRGQDALVVRVRTPTRLLKPDLIIEGDPPLWFGRPEVEVAKGGQTVFRAPILSPEAIAPLKGRPIRFTLIDGLSAIEAKGVLP